MMWKKQDVTQISKGTTSLITFHIVGFSLNSFFLRADWSPSLWLEVFDELLFDDNELDYGDQWSLNFSYSQTDKVTKEERRRGWKVYCHSAYGKYVILCSDASR